MALDRTNLNTNASEFVDWRDAFPEIEQVINCEHFEASIVALRCYSESERFANSRRNRHHGIVNDEITVEWTFEEPNADHIASLHC